MTTRKIVTKGAVKVPKTGMAWARLQGKPIEDAPEPLVIRLKPIDIKRGKRLDQTSCAFAKGICRQEEAQAVWIGLSSAFVEWSDKILRYTVPESVSRELISFDRSQIAAAGEFKLRVPAPSDRIGARPEYKPPRTTVGVERRLKGGTVNHMTVMTRRG